MPSAHIISPYRWQWYCELREIHFGIYNCSGNLNISSLNSKTLSEKKWEAKIIQFSSKMTSVYIPQQFMSTIESGNSGEYSGWNLFTLSRLYKLDNEHLRWSQIIRENFCLNDFIGEKYWSQWLRPVSRVSAEVNCANDVVLFQRWYWDSDHRVTN